MAKPKLHLVNKDPQQASNWLNFPAVVSAPSPEDRGILIDFRVGKEEAVRTAQAGRKSVVYEFWSIVNGSPPPILGAPKFDHDLSSLIQAHACFKGLKRPCAHDSSGSERLAYIIKPVFHYVYAPSMSALLQKAAVPDDVVFVVYVRLDEPFKPFANRAKGIVTHWQFVEADSVNRGLPSEFDERYDRQMW